ncbi:MAG TPA: DNA topoisomerase IV subunit A [Tenericutes bacterium]|nr:DNA topoisomerase IV subunit A [Mycoplasmatota bacterium]
MQDVINKIYEYSLEDIMGLRFGRYSKTVIQDRAIPDVRDGLKPVQRRILYSMYKDRNTYEKPHRKSAKTVGAVMGNFHPHGDSSIYEAMVRMSQWWKQSAPYVDMHGNNGSMDGDSPAAMRYTEARLSKISNELLKDIDKQTIRWAPNFDDTELEPTVLPAKFPAILVNGSTGISAGYATNIPPHNLGEVIDATIKRIDNPNCKLDTLIDIIKGPDFPTGGIVEGKKGIIEAYQTGRGKIIIRSKVEFIELKNKVQIVITEIPFDVNKQNLVKKIDEIRIDKKIDGILDVKDGSNREGIRINIDIKKDANRNLILNYLYKNTELQISYNYNMVAIVNRRPYTLGLIPILDAYIKHQKEVITKRIEFDLAVDKKRLHIVEGLIKALSILDDVIVTIRSSKNKSDAKENIIEKFNFTEQQAEAIVTLQLYKLTNTDVTELIVESNTLNNNINLLNEILNNEEKLKTVMKDELKQIKKEYANPRLTEIKDEITEIKIDTTEIIPKEDAIVVVTKEGYIKRVSPRSYSANDGETQVKNGDYVIGLYELNTLDTVLLFTDLGNYLYVPVYEIPDLKWKDLGKHISNIITIQADENIIASIPVTNFEVDKYVTMFTKNGMIKRTKLSDFKVTRYSKPMTAINLKNNDKLIGISYIQGTEVFISTKLGYGLRYNIDEVSPVGLKAAGVKSINLKNDEVVSGNVFDDNYNYITVITNKNTYKRLKISDIEKTSRARKGVLIVRDVKTNPYYILKTIITGTKNNLGIKNGEEIQIVKITDAPIADRYSTGTSISKEGIEDVFIVEKLQTRDNIEKNVMSEVDEKEELKLSNVDEKIMTIDDFLDNFEIIED